MEHSEASSNITKRLIVFNDEDFDALSESDVIKNKLVAKYNESRVFILEESYNNTKCPICGCPSISSIVDEDTNKFISECNGCKLRFIETLSQ